MTSEFGDVILVQFPFTSQAASKKRPAVVVSSAAYNAARPDLVLMAVTSQPQSTSEFGAVFVRGWSSAGLLKPPTVKPVFATLEQRLVIRTLGSLDAEDRSALKAAIHEVIG